MVSYRKRKRSMRSKKSFTKIKRRPRVLNKFKRKNRGSQRIKRTRWPVDNPFGDNLFYKVRFSYGTTLTIPTTASSINLGFQMNSLASIISSAGNAPGLNSLGNAFVNYRIRGLKTKMTLWPDSATVPIVAYHLAGASQSEMASITPNVSTLPELRWQKYRTCNYAAAGAKPTRLNSYFSVDKVYGPDAVVKNDSNFVGNITTAAPPAPPVFGAPGLGPGFRFGLFTMSGLNPTVAVNCVTKIEFTAYVNFFSKRGIIN
ncbi:capsid protein [Apteryx rowi circovirus-like virus]|uniref:capsid protein n=1 Tax=Apteryx rowi circovirus-like virus TaxID=1634476 RepID=UPI000620B17F|nr:capsid protein [Apteryx rowi circovirus-like virus]AKE44323.1 capsid protein [Apteryx rowi circovirus-like virus]